MGGMTTKTIAKIDRTERFGKGAGCDEDGILIFFFFLQKKSREGKRVPSLSIGSSFREIDSSDQQRDVCVVRPRVDLQSTNPSAKATQKPLPSSGS
jgi:hypothetical protein